MCLPLFVASRPFVQPLRLIEWCAVQPSGLPAGGPPAIDCSDEPFLWRTHRKRDRQIEGWREQERGMKWCKNREQGEEGWGRMWKEWRRKRKTGEKKCNISLNESLLAVSVSQLGKEGGLASGPSPFLYLFAPLLCPLFSALCVCVCVCKGRGLR